MTIKHVMMAAALAVSTFVALPATAATVVSPTGARGLVISTYATVGQSFTMVGTTLDSFGFQLQTANGGSANDPLNFTLRAGDGLTGAILAQRTITAPLGATRANFWQDFSLSGLTLSDGAVYTALLTAGSNRLALLYGPAITANGVDGYAGGRLIAGVAQTGYCTGAPCDANFRFTSSGPVAGAVPEPAAWALMLLGFATVGTALRRRRTPDRMRQIV